jgi:hypothetical protein
MVAQVVTDERQILERLDGALNDLSRVRIDQEAAERAEAEMARLLRNLMPPRIVSPRISSSPPPWAPVSVGRCQAIPRERPSGEWDPQCP